MTDTLNVALDFGIRLDTVRESDKIWSAAKLMVCVQG